MVDWLLLTVACFFVGVNADVYADNGWRPMSIEKVLELQRNFIKTPNVELRDLKNPPERPMGDSDEGSLVKITQKNMISELKNRKIMPLSQSDHRMKNKELIEIIQPPYNEVIALKNEAIGWDAHNFFQQKLPLRRAKMIEHSNTVAHLSSTVSNQINGNDKIQRKEDVAENSDKSSSSERNNTYEVKEIVDEKDQWPSEQELLGNKALKDDVSKLTRATSNNNFTANLLSILRNYNIRTDDKLPNYEISVRKNSRKSDDHDYIFMYVPVKTSLKYNNANHLPVDPLLAVLLSNYGYYLPTLYGFHRGYNNLYGYLASNNIHNNKPFGSYKIFSDSDSSY